jgi:hypothetical protein
MKGLIQKLINKYYRYPKAKLREIERFGGETAYKDMLAQKDAMTKSIINLIPLKKSNGKLKIYFLTGKKYIEQTLFCIFSLEKQMDETFKYVLVDDGTFDLTMIDFVNTKLPNVEIAIKSVIDKNITTYLPMDKFPVLNWKRAEYPHIKKLTDVHTLNNCEGYKLVLDSDMLFNHPPVEIKSWLENPNKAIHMVDCDEAYGYSHLLMEQLCGSAIPKLVNVGVFGIDSNEVNWSNLERWIKELEEAEGASYYLEQALSAMLIAGKSTTILDKEKYKVNPPEKEIDKCNATLHHYVDLSKKGYFTKAWKKFV